MKKEYSPFEQGKNRDGNMRWLVTVASTTGKQEEMNTGP